jgi:hypothetical protein
MMWRCRYDLSGFAPPLSTPPALWPSEPALPPDWDALGAAPTMTMCGAITDALDIALKADPNVVVRPLPLPPAPPGPGRGRAGCPLLIVNVG